MSTNDQNPIPPGNEDPTLSDDTADEIDVASGGESDLDAESQSQSPLPVDTHSAPLDHPAQPLPITAEEVLGAEGKTGQAEQPPPTPIPGTPTTPVGQAAQTVVVGAKQAAQQVTAAVQQSAQKITVAPRQAIYRGKRFLAIYSGLAGGAAVVALLARKHRYFVGDIGIARVIQEPQSRLYNALMYAVSELGWRWISVGARASATSLMWAAGFRMESAFTLSTWSGDVLTGLIKSRVLRPRPTKDLVRVVSQLGEASFPSGHVVHYVTFYGFLFYLVFTHLKKRWFRTALLTLLAGLILLVGPSRVYMGHHWPSDVGGAYLVGTLWLGLIIIAYIETKAHYTLNTQPPFFVKRPTQLT
ncbi:MAG: phosphatase PAP2 family protein [Chloroflexota bacterium]